MPRKNAPRALRLRPRRDLALLCCAATAGLAAPRARGTTYNWADVTSGGNWSVAGNWNPNTGVPFTGDTAFFKTSSSTAFTLNYDYVVSGTGLTLLDIDPFGTGNLIFSQANATSVMVAGSEIVGNNTDGAATAIYNQGANTTNNPLLLTIGYLNGGNGIYSLNGGAMSAGTIFTGSAAGSVGVFNVSSGVLTASGAVTIGNAGTGTFTQTNGATTFNGGFTVANTGGTGTVNLLGGTFTSTQGENVGLTSGNAVFNQIGGTNTTSNLEIAYGGAKGIYTLINGTLTVTGTDVNVGRSGAGTFTQIGGVANLPDFYLAALGSGTGTMNIVGGQVNVTNTAYVGGYFGGAGGAGVLNVSNTGILNSSGDLHIYGTDSGTNHSGINLSAGGTINAASITTADWSRVSLTGGTLNLTGGVSSNAGNLTISGISGAATVNQNGGGVYGGTFNVGTTGGVAAYNMQSGTLVAGVFNVGDGGLGTYSQTNGTSVFNSFVLCANVGAGGGTATISGGTFTTGLLDVSEQYGSSTFNQVAGTVNVTGSFILTINGTKATYNLQGGTANFTSASTSSANIGLQGGNAIFNQSGGVSNFSSGWTADGFGTNLGTVLLSSTAVMNASNSLIIGNFGTASLTQTGGTTKVTAGGVYLGYQSGGQGTLNVTNGTFTTPRLYVGNVGSGTVTQSGGLVSTTGGLFIAPNPSSRGTYVLSGGTLTAGGLLVGDDTGAVGTFNHSGGVATFSSVNLGSISSANGIGTYNLSNGATVTFSGLANVGNVGAGIWNQTGGVSNFNGSLSIGNGAAGGTVTLSGGTLTSPTIFLNSGGQLNLVSTATNAFSYTTFNQTGGTFTASGHEYLPSGATYTQSGGVHSASSGGLYVAPTPGGSGTYTLSIGTLTANRIGIGSDDTGTGGAGVFNQNGGTVNVTDGFFGLALAGQNSGSAVYNLTTGSLNVNAIETIGGQSAPGTFNQSGGSHALSGQLQNLNLGTFNLSAGTFTAGSIQLNAGSTFNYTGGTLKSAGGVTQSGGTFSGTGSAVFFVDSLKGVASYTLNGGVFTTTNYVDVGSGSGDSGVVTQTAGTYAQTGVTVTNVGFSSGVGVYNLKGGTFSPNQLELGANGGTGTFNQSGGTATSNAFVMDGNGGLGTYNLSGGTYTGNGAFHLGNTNGTAVDVFNVSGGSLSVPGGIVVLGGDNGTNHTAINLSGTGTITTPSITAPDWSRLNFAAGTLNLSGTSSNTGTLTVANAGNATLNHSGGSVFATGLSLASASGAVGTYNLSGVNASLSVNNVFNKESIGTSGTGNFNQSGGTNSTYLLYLGENATGVGTYSLSNAASLVVGGINPTNTGSLSVGYQGQGIFNQTGGSNSVSRLFLGFKSASSGTYNLGGGTLMAGEETVGSSGTGVFNQNAGTNSTAALFIGLVPNSIGTYTQNGGQTLVTGGTYLGGDNTDPAGVGTVNLNGGSFNTGTNAITIYGTGSGFNQTALNVQGGSLTAGNVVNQGNFAVIAGSATVAALSGTGGLAVSGSTLSLTSFSQSMVEVDGPGRLVVSGATPAHTLNTATSLAISGNGAIDLAASDLVTQAPLNSVRGYLANAAANAFAGTGTNAAIYSSVVALDASHKSIAYLSGANTNNASLNAALTNTAAVLIRPSLIGDFNIDGKVDRFDIRAFNARNAFNDGLTTHDWADGDLNFDGKVDRFDIRAFNAGNNFNSGVVFAQTLTSTSPAAVGNTTTVGTAGDGKPDLVYNSTTGDVVFKYDGYDPGSTHEILELDIGSSKNSLNANGVNAGAAGSISKGPSDIDYQNLGSTPIADGTDLGTIFPIGLMAAQLTTNNITANFFLNGDGSPTKFADVVGAGGVPEPATLSLIGVAAAGLLSRRRRK